MGLAVLLGCGALAGSSHVGRKESSPKPINVIKSPPASTTSMTAEPTTTSRSSTTIPGLLAGKIVGVDLGHNGLNYSDPSYIDQMVFNGREYETCNTTGTSTDADYTEALFNFNVATYLEVDLRAEGAKVVRTQSNNDGVGPCVTQRAAIIYAPHANVVINADGGPPDGRGFAIVEPVAGGPNDAVISASESFALLASQQFGHTAGMPVSTYDGVDGLQPRDNLASLNLTTVPEVLIECGNIRNATDAALLVTSTFQRQASLALAQVITEYLT